MSTLIVPAEYNRSKNNSQKDLEALEKQGLVNWETLGYFGALYEFHKALNDKIEASGKAVGRTQALGQDYVPGNATAALRAALIQEEANECIEALAMKPAHYCLKEICDLIYVAVGTAVTYGWKLDGAFETVHKNNMEKIEKGTIREDGKLKKPADWANANVKEFV